MAAASRPPIVYEPTASGLPPLRPYIAGLWERRRFMWHLARTDLKAEHYDTAIGQLWVVVNPLLSAAVYFLFRTVIKPAGSGANRNLVLSHLVWAVFFFTFTSNALSTGARSILGGRQLILNSAFPRAVLPLVVDPEGAARFHAHDRRVLRIARRLEATLRARAPRAPAAGRDPDGLQPGSRAWCSRR